MVPWDMLPKDLQKAILAMIVLYGGSRVCGYPGPIICDPPPPPTTSTWPTPTRTPMVCDPPPPPRIATPTRTPMVCDPPPPPRTVTPSKTPMICDPPPPPFVTPGVPGPRHFQVRRLQTISDPSVPGAQVRGQVVDLQGQPISGLQVTAQGTSQIQVLTGIGGEFVVYIPDPGDYRIVVGGDQVHGVQLELRQHDVVTMEWVEIRQTSQSPLPLAEIRTVDILWDDGLTFGAETPWPNARYRWSVSGGALAESEGRVTWQPPAEPGRYLLQVAADWGQAGLAVDALTLIVEQDGSVSIG